MKRNSYFPILLLALLLTGAACSSSVPASDDRPVRIAISKAVPYDSYQNYVRWIRHTDSTAEYFDLYHLSLDSAMALLETCDGLLLTGGTDIYPGRYGKEYDTARCWEPDFKRDTLEVSLLRRALASGQPVMAICRGLQITNVELGGKLYIDLPADLDTLVSHQKPDTYAANHTMTVVTNSLLHEISGIESGTTNSNHHQGIEVLAPGLRAIAFTDDGLAEAIQLDDTTGQFLLGVQWHPERMDYNNPLSGKISRRFLEEANKYQHKKHHE